MREAQIRRHQRHLGDFGGDAHRQLAVDDHHDRAQVVEKCGLCLPLVAQPDAARTEFQWRTAGGVVTAAVENVKYRQSVEILSGQLQPPGVHYSIDTESRTRCRADSKIQLSRIISRAGPAPTVGSTDEVFGRIHVGDVELTETHQRTFSDIHQPYPKVSLQRETVGLATTPAEEVYERRSDCATGEPDVI
ncbi:hypothetical protein [Nocardia brasiliensis]|uniref:hypothetical protein n=1 Tax=Nocardia brasiliensis TaxID=37326 RepID=UPI003D8B44FA